MISDEINENIHSTKENIKNTTILIRNSMNHHKKNAKTLHSHIKKEKKKIDLYKEKIAKLTVEREKLEIKPNKNEDNKIESDEVSQIKSLILKEIADKKELDDKIKEVKEEFLIIKNDMGGLNATQVQQERYEKHIKILENRLDKANQKFNESIEHDKKLREEIDKLRKERFFFENIYKKLEKELEKLRKEISVNLESAYESYEKRDRNQELFENIKAQMMKMENEYATQLSNLASEISIRNSRRKSIEYKELKTLQNNENNELNLTKHFNKKHKSDQLDQAENIQEKQEKLQNLQYKFQKLEEFTEQTSVESFCKNFKKNEQKNCDLFMTISMISKQAKQLEKEIKDLEDEIEGIKIMKTGQAGIEKNALLNELKSKTQKLVQKQDKYENEAKKNIDEFKSIKSSIYQLYTTLGCEKEISIENKILMETGVTESNVKLYISQIEIKLKKMLKFFEMEKIAIEGEYYLNNKVEKNTKNLKQVMDDMKSAFSMMEISKLKTLDNIKNSNKNEEIKFDMIKEYSEKICKELMDQVEKTNNSNHEKKSLSKSTKKK